MLRRQISFTLLLALLALWAPGCGDSGGTDGGGGSASAVNGGDSPEDVIAKARTMVETRDFKGIVNLIAPDERPLMSVGMLMLSQMAPMLMGGLGGALGGEAVKGEMEEKMKPFEEAIKGVMEKHGTDKLDLEAAMGTMQGGNPEDAVKWINEQAPNLDHGAFVADVLEAITQLGDEAADKASGNFNELSGEMTDLEIKGDTATAKINDKPGEFRKVDGRWYISIKGQL